MCHRDTTRVPRWCREPSGPRTGGARSVSAASAHHVARTWRMIRRPQPHPAAPVAMQAEAVQLPVSVLRMVRQQTCGFLAGNPARYVHVDKFVFRHRIYCAGRGRVRIASALCLMLCSPPLPRYAPPPRLSRPHSTATWPRSSSGRATTTRPSTRRSTSWPPRPRSTTSCSTTATTRSPLRDPRFGDDTLPPYTGPEEPNALSVLIRRDYAVVEPQRLLAQAQRVEAVEEDGATAAAGFDAASGTVHGALGVLFGEFEPDEIASRHKEFGLEEGDSTLWVTAADEPADPGEWLETPSRRSTPSASSAVSTSARSSTTSRTTRKRTTTSTRTPSWTRTETWSPWTPIADPGARRWRSPDSGDRHLLAREARLRGPPCEALPARPACEARPETCP